MHGVSSFPLFRPIIDKGCLPRIRHLLNLRLKGAINPEGFADRKVCIRGQCNVIKLAVSRSYFEAIHSYNLVFRGDRSTFKYPLCKLHLSIIQLVILICPRMECSITDCQHMHSSFPHFV